MTFLGIQYAYKMNYSSIKNLDKYKTLTISVPKKWICMVQLNRPEKLNALNDTMWRYIFLLNLNLVTSEI